MQLSFGKEAMCTMSNGVLIIEPIYSTSDGDFAEQILTDLIEEGYSGQALLSEFKARQAKVRPAVEAMLEAAKNAANNNGAYSTFDDVFGLEEEDK